MIQRVQVESLASVVAEKLPKLPVAAEAGGLDVAGEAFLGEKRGGGAVLMVQDLAGKLKLKVQICIFGKLFGVLGRENYPSGNKSISQGKRNIIIFKSAVGRGYVS